MTPRGFQRRAWSVALVLLALGLVRPAFADVTLRDAWVAEPPPGALTTVAYGVLTNAGPDVVEIVAASSPACERVEMHRTTHREGVVGMEPLDRITLAPGESVHFEPGATHWMLIRPRALAHGDEVELTLELADGSRVRLRLPVERRGTAPHHH